MSLIDGKQIIEKIENILMSDNIVMGFEELQQTGYLRQVLPELDATAYCEQNCPSHKYNVFRHQLYSAATVRKNRLLRWTMLMHDIGKPLVKIREIDKDSGKEKDAFRGHEEKSAEVAAAVMKRLGFEQGEMDIIEKLIRFHCADLYTKEDIARQIKNLGSREMFEYFIEVAEADFDSQSDLWRSKKEATIQRIQEFAKEVGFEKDSRDGMDLL